MKSRQIIQTPCWLFCLLILAAFTSFAGLPGTAARAAEPVGFKPIFNGQDLTGWEGEEKFWRVENGAIVAESTAENPCTKNSFLRWADGKVDDFELRLQFRISGSAEANSGIQFRSQIADDGHVVGYQADIDLAGKWLGACYDEHGRGLLAGRGESAVVKGPKEIERTSIGNRDELLKAVKLDDWNEYHILAQGNELTLKINGQVMSKVLDEDLKNQDFSGILALQLHSGPPMKVEFREIQLKRLPLKDRTKIVFVAGTRSHAYFAHEHNAGCLLLADSLNRSGLPVQTAVYLNGWPRDVTAFDNADTVVFYNDGGGRHILNPHLDEFDQVMKRGTGVVCLHYAVETVAGKEGDHFLKWMGGYFEPHWSVNPHWMAYFDKLPDHPITRGVKPFAIQDEWYYHMRFTPELQGVTPILSDLPPSESLTRPDGPHSGNPHVRESVLVRKEPQHVAWAFNRPDGGRGFGFTGGHFHVNWQHDEFRKLVLNAIVWTAGKEVPKQGVVSPTPSDEQMEQNQDYPKPDNWKYEPPKTSTKRPAPATSQNSSSQPATEKATAEKGNAEKPAVSSKPLFASPVVTTRTPGHAVSVDVPIAGAKKLFLVMSDGKDSFSCDWANWAEPRLVGPQGEKKLTELKWKTASSDWGQMRVNANANGQPLIIDGAPVEYGIGTHANSIIEFDLPADHRFERFQARGGLDAGGTRQNNGQSTSVQFFVFDQQPSPQFLASTRSAAAAASQSRNLEDALSQLTVAEGLAVQIFAGEPQILNPTSIDIDARGRVWVCEVVNYRHFRNQDVPSRPEGDRILILEDTDGDGVVNDIKVFYQGTDVDSAHGICVLGNRVLISCGDSVFWLIDDNNDDKADRKEVLFTGIGGVQHDHGIHACTFGPDGKLYFNFGNEGRQIKDKHGNPIIDKQGNLVNDSRKPYQEGMAFRCNLDGSEFETLGWNFRNNWELCVDSFGAIWQSDNDDDGNRGVRINYVMEFGNYGYRDELTGAGWREPRTNMEAEIPERHWYQNDPGSIPNLLLTGGGSPTGILIYEGDLLPEVFRNQLIHCDAGPNIVRAYPVKPSGAGYTAEIVDILHGSNDQWFRPADVCVGPDGSLFVADWYDPGVGGHRMADVERGRIFRLAPPNTPYRFPAVDVSTPTGAAAALQSPNLATRYLGWTALQKFGEAAENSLLELTKSENPRLQARAFWVLGKLEIPHDRKRDYVRLALVHRNPEIRAMGIRLARQLAGEISIQELGGALSLQDDSPVVRREMLICLRDLNLPNAAEYWAELALQHDGQDRWYLEALGIAADRHWAECLSAWLSRVGENWNTPAGRDILWRSRAPQTAQYLAQIILDPNTPTADLPRYFRAFDFNKPVDQKLLAGLAFHRGTADAERRTLIATEALQRISAQSLTASPEHAAAFEELLDTLTGTTAFVSLVERFQQKNRYPQLLTLAIEQADQQGGVDAIRVLIRQKQWDVLEAGFQQEQTAACKLADVLGLCGENSSIELLLQVMNNSQADHEVRRAAARALGKIRPGAEQLVKLSQAKQIDPIVVPAVAAALHASAWNEIKKAAETLYPLPPSKDAKPLPPLSELAKRQGNVPNGRFVYHNHGTCAKCHVVNGLGREVGPDLSEIGKKLDRQAMLEAILYPSAGISHNYETYTLVTVDGNILTGLLVSQTDAGVSLKNAEGIVRSIPADDVDELVKQQVSLMPADLQKEMSEQDLVDLVEFLMTLKEKK